MCSAKAAEGVFGNQTPTLFFYPAGIGQNLDASKPSSDVAHAVNSFGHGKFAAPNFLDRDGETVQRGMLAMTHFVPSYRYKLAASYFVRGALSRITAEVGELGAVEIEIGPLSGLEIARLGRVACALCAIEIFCTK
jgi:hypothetical protein